MKVPKGFLMTQFFFRVLIYPLPDHLTSDPESEFVIKNEAAQSQDSGFASSGSQNTDPEGQDDDEKVKGTTAGSEVIKVKVEPDQKQQKQAKEGSDSDEFYEISSSEDEDSEAEMDVEDLEEAYYSQQSQFIREHGLGSQV